MNGRQAQAKALQRQAETLFAEARRLQAEANRLRAEAGVDVPSHASPEGARLLTRRQQQVARLIARGDTNRQIARALVITEGTAANHVRYILQRLGMHSRVEVAAWAVRHGLMTTED
ncbi:MAG TPA: LuxR C-terminal-related transcriptional regulator [Chloroflexota bacterium]|nr:LuxR C-terminal-related transcriptional regulator [Chloroflexota bacterium]